MINRRRAFRWLWQFNAMAIALLSLWFAFGALGETPAMWRRLKSAWLPEPQTETRRQPFVPQAVKTTLTVDRVTNVPDTPVLIGPVESSNQAGSLQTLHRDTVLVDLKTGKQQTVRGSRVRNYLFHNTVTGDTQRLLPKNDTSNVVEARALMDDGTALVFYGAPQFSPEKPGIATAPRRLFFQVVAAAEDGTASPDQVRQVFLTGPDGTGRLELAVKISGVLGHFFPTPESLVLMARTAAGVRSLRINLATGEIVSDRAVFP
jgi:hypothetical protein